MSNPGPRRRAADVQRSAQSSGISTLQNYQESLAATLCRCYYSRMFPGRIAACLLSLAIPESIAAAQDHPHRPPYDGSAAPDIAQQIHVDAKCRILSDPKPPFPAHKPAPFRDPNVCHIEGVLGSEHREEQVNGNQLQRSMVRVSEQTYVLQNITGDHVVFVLEFPVPAGW